MASKRQKRKKSCEGKYRYFDGDSAKTAALALRRDKGLTRVHAYHCKFCNSWHVGRAKIRRR